MMPAALFILLGLVAVQDMLTGLFGAPSIVATIIASRAMGPRRALLLSTVAQFIGPFLFGVAVAGAVGSEVVQPSAVNEKVVASALAATVIWMVAAWYLSIPSSSTHALIGGLVGAVLAGAGPQAVQGDGFLKLLLSLTLTAPLGIVGGFVAHRACNWLARGATPRVNHWFNRGQLVTSLVLGFAIGSNNAQNAMGVTVLSLMATGYLSHFTVPVWVIAFSAAFLAIGNLVGGMRVMKSVSSRFFRIRPIHGLSAELSSAVIIMLSSLYGGDVSTTHVTNMSIIGAGAAERMNMVRWGFVQRVLLTWVITIPLTALLAVLFYGLVTVLIRLFLPS